MRRFISLGLGIALIAVLGSALTTLGPASAAPNLQRETSPCIGDGTKFLKPDVILLGEETAVTLTVTAVCAGETFPLHIVLVLDESGSMAGSKSRDMKQAAVRLVQNLRMDENPATQVGVVGFNSNARTLSPLTNQPGRAIGGIQRLGANGGTAIDRGITEGLTVLRRGRNRGGGVEISEVMVVLSDGGNNAGCAPVLNAANQAKGQGVTVVSICVGNDCDAACMRQVASATRYFFNVQDSRDLVNVFEEIRRNFVVVSLRKLNVRDLLPPNMELLERTIQDRPKRVGPNLDDIEWEDNYIPTEGITYSYMIKPMEPGYHPVSLGATGEFRDSRSREGQINFNIPWVTVLSPEVQPTPSAPPVPPTFTPTPTITPTPTPTVIPSPTPTPTPPPIYLPILVREYCRDRESHIDMVLVLDMSTSMYRSVAPGQMAKADAVVFTGKALVDILELEPNADGEHDQLAVAGFNRKAWVETSLTNDATRLRKALERLPKGIEEYTRLDLAVKVGIEQLEHESRIPENRPVLVVLTDGLPNQVPFGPDGKQESTVLQWTDLAKSKGIELFTIGIGAPGDTMDWLLELMATDAEHFYYSPDPEDLVEVYEALTPTKRCPTGTHQWGEPWPPPGHGEPPPGGN